MKKDISQPGLTQGCKTAMKIKRQNTIARTVCFLCLCTCGGWLFYSIAYNHFWQYCLSLIIIIFSVPLFRLYYSRIHWILNIDCDPYTAEEVYTYLYSRRSSSPHSQMPLQYQLLLARCRLFQGDFEKAYSILIQMDTGQLKQNWMVIYYDLMRMYYSHKPDLARMEAMKKSFYKLSQNTAFSRKNRKFMLNEIKMIDLSHSLETGDLSVYDSLSRKEEWKKGRGITQISRRWADARAHRLMGDIEAARTDCYYVIANGNRLYYVDLAKKMLQEL